MSIDQIESKRVRHSDAGIEHASREISDARRAGVSSITHPTDSSAASKHLPSLEIQGTIGDATTSSTPAVPSIGKSSAVQAFERGKAGTTDHATIGTAGADTPFNKENRAASVEAAGSAKDKFVSEAAATTKREQQVRNMEAMGVTIKDGEGPANALQRSGLTGPEASKAGAIIEKSLGRTSFNTGDKISVADEKISFSRTDRQTGEVTRETSPIMGFESPAANSSPGSTPKV